MSYSAGTVSRVPGRRQSADQSLAAAGRASVSEPADYALLAELMAALMEIERRLHADQQRQHEIVAECRKLGASWALLGKALNISAQAAQKRYGRSVAVDPHRVRVRGLIESAHTSSPRVPLGDQLVITPSDLARGMSAQQAKRVVPSYRESLAQDEDFEIEFADKNELTAEEMAAIASKAGEEMRSIARTEGSHHDRVLQVVRVGPRHFRVAWVEPDASPQEKGGLV